jgi:hypothetical protein
VVAGKLVAKKILSLRAIAVSNFGTVFDVTETLFLLLLHL